MLIFTRQDQLYVMPYIVFSIRIVTVLYELFENIWKAEVEYYKEKIY